MSRLNIWPWLRPFLVMVAVVSIPPLLYWFGYVQTSVKATRQRAHTTLSAVSADLRDQLDSHVKISEYAENKTPAADSSARGGRKSQIRFLADYLKSVLNTRAEPTSNCWGQATDTAPTDGKPRDPQSFTRLSIAPGTGGLLMHADLPPVGNELCTIHAKVPLDNLIAWDLVAADFDGLLVLDNEGKLLAQDRRLPGQPLGVEILLNGLPDNLRHLRTSAAPKTPPSELHPPSVLRSPFEASGDVSVELAGEEYLVFVQAVRVPMTFTGGKSSGANSEPPPPPLTVNICGLIRKERLRSEAIALSPQTLVVIGTFLALGMFSIPFLKLRFIGSRERLRTRDLWLLGGATLCGTALAVLALLNQHAQVVIQERIDGHLKDGVTAVKQQLLEESTAAFKTLTESASRLVQSDELVPVGSILSSNELGMQAATNPAHGGELRFVDFDSIYSLDLTGRQTHKWAARTLATPFTNLGDREYYIRALTMTGESDYFFDSVISRTTGSQIAILAAPYSLRLTRSNEGEGAAMGAHLATEDRAGVVAISYPMRTLTDAVVAEPLQLVLIDRNGKVSFQHAQGPFTGEYFFQNVRSGESLVNEARGSVGSSPTTTRPYEYRGQTFRMSALYIPQLQSTLVGYYDQRLVSRLSARAFVTSIVFAMGIVLAILTGAALTKSWCGARAFDWAWPSPQLTCVYLLAAALSLVSMVLLWLVRSFAPSGVTTCFVLLFPLITMLMLGSGQAVPATQWLCARLGMRPNGHTLRSRRRTAFAFHAAAVMTLIALVAWPTAVVFDDALAAHTSAFANRVTHQWQLDRTRRDAKLDALVVGVQETLTSPDCLNSNASGIHDMRCSAVDRIFATEANRIALEKTRAKFGVFSGCLDALGTVGCTSVSASRSAPQKATPSFTAPLAAMLIANSDKQQALSKELDSIATADGEPPASVTQQTLPEKALGDVAKVARQHHPFFAWFLVFSWATPAFLLLVGLLVLLISSAAKHVLGIGVLYDVLLDESEVFSPKAGSRWLLLRPGQATLKRIGAPSASVNLLDPTATVTLLAAPPSGKVLLVTHVEYRLHDEAWRKALLHLLRGSTEGCVIYVSEIDPLFYISQRVAEMDDVLAATVTNPDTHELAAQECRRWRTDAAEWASALREVHKIRDAVDTSNRMCGGTASDATRNKIRAECQANEYLMDIGERLLQRDDIDKYRWDDIVGFILDAAEPYYRSAWDLCSREEQLVLIQLAQEGLVNPKRLELARRLARRNLVTVDPHLQPMNESFARFLCAVESPERITRWEHSGSGASWSRYGTPLYALAAVIIAILLFTQQETLTNIVGVFAAASGTLGTLRNLYSANVKPVLAVAQSA